MIGAWKRAGRIRTSTISAMSTSTLGSGSAEEARQAGDDAVAGLDKITAQMSGGEHRPEQQEMCRAVAEAVATRTHLVVQAGTGTGKSLAYLVPAALSGKRWSWPRRRRRYRTSWPRRTCPRSRRVSGSPRRSISPCSRDAATTSAGSGWPRWARAGFRPSSATRVARPTSRHPSRRSRRGRAMLRHPKASSRRCASWWPGRRRQRAVTGPT